MKPAPVHDLVELRARPEAMHVFQGHSLLVAAQDGVVRGDGNQGLYQDNTRIISTWRHLIDGKELGFVSASAVDAYSMLAYYQAKHIQEEVPGLTPEEPGLIVQVERFVGEGMHEDVLLCNHAQRVVECELQVRVSADFADFAEATEGKRRQCAEVSTRWQAMPDGSGELTMTYGHPSLDRAAVARFPFVDGSPCFSDASVGYRVRLEPGEEKHFCFEIAPKFDGRCASPVYGCHAFGHPGGERDRMRARFLAEATTLRAANADVQAAWDHAAADLADLALYEGEWPEALTPAAGIPAYQSVFGRDIVTASWQAAMLNPVLMPAVIASTAHHIGARDDDFHDEQPGRVVQQVNRGPLATLGITPFKHYYGDFAAPPQFLTVVAQSYMWSGDRDVLRRQYPAAERVLQWIDRYADPDGDGFVEYDTRSPVGQKNQGWKDSSVAMVYENGRGVQNPIAACELQAYVYVAKQQYAAAIALGLHKYREAARLLREAARLKRRFNERFWMEPEQYIALCLDADKRQARSITSNPGHCLAAGIVDGKHARAVAQRLMSPDLFSGWGIRTLSADHPAYNPFSYQLGSVWPVESATIAFGLKRYGFHEECNRLVGAMFEASALFPHHRLPEVLGGEPRDARHPHPGVYPQAELPQAWSASAVPLLVQAMLGLRPIAPLRLLLIDPVLPEWLPRVELRDLRVGDAVVSLQFRRSKDGRTTWKVSQKHGPLRVVQQPPESSVFSGLWERGQTGARSFVPGAH